MRFTSLILKNLTRRPLRTALTLVAFATAIAAVVALLGIANGFTKSFAAVYESHAVDIVVSRQGTSDRLSSSVDQDVANEVQKIDGVDRAAGVLLETMSLEEQEIYGVAAMGVAKGSWLLDDYDLETQGDIREAPDRSVILGRNLADRVGVQPGGEVMIFEEPYIVSGIFTSRSTWENGSMIFPLEELQRLTDRIGQVTYVNVVLQKPSGAEKAEQAIDRIQALDRKLNALTTDEFVDSDTRMQLAGAMASMTSIIALAIGAIGTLNTMMTSVLERTREIGILRAMGWPSKRIAAMIGMESIAIALIASVLGSILAMIATWVLSQSDIAKGVLNPSIDARVMLQGAAIGLLIGLFGALLPAWRATRMLPTDAFRD